MIFVHKIKNDNKKLKKSEKMEHPSLYAKLGVDDASWLGSEEASSAPD